MQTDSDTPFANNWAYLKTELNWLDRLLMLAVARQRQDTKEVDRIAQSRADRVTSHWWKGIIAINQQAAYDNCPPPKSATGKSSYQQQLETRIRASQNQDIILALPTLRDRLKLSLFAKNLILLTLAPEVNRRYGRLYSYLQKEDKGIQTDLPTVDLALRLLCRNDLEWRQSRAQLAESTSLIRHNILHCLSSTESTLLSSHLKLPSWLVNYLLAEQPDPAVLTTGLASPFTVPSDMPSGASSLIRQQPPAVNRADLVLPEPLMSTLQHLCQQVTGLPPTIDQPLKTDGKAHCPSGIVVLMVGQSGTGKTLAARVIAQWLNLPCLWTLNLSLMASTASADAISATIQQAPALLLVKSAQVWFGRNPLLTQSQVNQWLRQRRQIPGITLLTAHHLQSIRPFWRHQLDAVLEFPRPNEAARLKLWRQAFPTDIPLDCQIDWRTVAHQLPLTGGEIQAIARAASLYASQSDPPKLTLTHLQQALAQRGKSLTLKLRKMPK